MTTMLSLPTSSSATQTHLALRFQRGDRDALGELYRLLQGAVRAAALRELGSMAEAEDVMQWTFLRAWQKRETLREPARIGAWLRRIAVYRARSVQAGRGRQQEGEGVLEGLTFEGPSVEERLVRGEERSRLHAAILELPTRQREVVALRVGRSMSFGEIAQEVGCSDVSARVNFSYAVQRLKERLAA